MIWTGAYIATMAAVLLAVRPPLLVCTIIIANTMATMALRDSVLAVGVADVAAGALVLLCGAVWWPVAALYALMTFCDVAEWWFSLDLNTTYAITETLSYVQLFIIAGGSGGTFRRNRLAHSPDDRRGSVAHGRMGGMRADQGNPCPSFSNRSG